MPKQELNRALLGSVIVLVFLVISAVYYFFYENMLDVLPDLTPITPLSSPYTPNYDEPCTPPNCK